MARDKIQADGNQHRGGKGQDPGQCYGSNSAPLQSGAISRHSARHSARQDVSRRDRQPIEFCAENCAGSDHLGQGTLRTGQVLLADSLADGNNDALPANHGAEPKRIFPQQPLSSQLGGWSRVTPWMVAQPMPAFRRNSPEPQSHGSAPYCVFQVWSGTELETYAKDCETLVTRGSQKREHSVTARFGCCSFRAGATREGLDGDPETRPVFLQGSRHSCNPSPRGPPRVCGLDFLSSHRTRDVARV